MFFYVLIILNSVYNFILLKAASLKRAFCNVLLRGIRKADIMALQACLWVVLIL